MSSFILFATITCMLLKLYDCAFSDILLQDGQQLIPRPPLTRRPGNSGRASAFRHSVNSNSKEGLTSSSDSESTKSDLTAFSGLTQTAFSTSDSKSNPSSLNQGYTVRSSNQQQQQQQQQPQRPWQLQNPHSELIHQELSPLQSSLDWSTQTNTYLSYAQSYIVHAITRSILFDHTPQPQPKHERINPHHLPPVPKLTSKKNLRQPRIVSGDAQSTTTVFQDERKEIQEAPQFHVPINVIEESKRIFQAAYKESFPNKDLSMVSKNEFSNFRLTMCNRLMPNFHVVYEKVTSLSMNGIRIPNSIVNRMFEPIQPDFVKIAVNNQEAQIIYKPICLTYGKHAGNDIVIDSDDSGITKLSELHGFILYTAKKVVVFDAPWNNRKIVTRVIDRSKISYGLGVSYDLNRRLFLFDQSENVHLQVGQNTLKLEKIQTIKHPHHADHEFNH